MKIFFTQIIVFISIFALNSQNSVGLISYNKEKAFEGYNLVFPHNQSNVYLLNNCGEIIHTWPDSNIWRPGNIAYLTKEGKLIKGKRNRNVTQDKIWSGGGGGIVEIRDWDNNLEWTFEINDSLRRLHHDFKPMPNGNILMPVWNLKTKDELFAAGRDTVKYKDNFLLSESIIEVNPKTNEVVWEWDLWNHFVQDIDSTRANYGNVALSPGKVNINFPTNTTTNSWFHINAIDYNEELDQIVVSVPTFNEIWIIDHTTTKTQAAGNTGGLSGLGGQLMYRWGNPAAYNKNDVFDQKLFFQHNIHWATEFISPSNQNYGKLAVFNNLAGPNYSTANFITPPWDMYEWKYTKTNGAWGPESYDATIQHPEATKMFSSGLSSFQLLPNNNMLILVGRSGYAFEITPWNEIVWEYRVPLKNGIPVTQGTTLSFNDNITFRMFRYPSDFIAFKDKDLDIKGFIELNPDETYCEQLVNVNETNISTFEFFPNPAVNQLNIISDEDCTIVISDIYGNQHFQSEIAKGNQSLNINLRSGTYILKQILPTKQNSQLLIIH